MTAFIDSMMQWLPWAGAVLAFVAVAISINRGYKAKKAVTHFASMLHGTVLAAGVAPRIDGIPRRA